MESNNVEKAIEARIATIILRKDGIIQQNIKDDVVLDVADVHEINDAKSKLTNNKKSLVLIITGERNGSTVAARKLGAEQLRHRDDVIAGALVINSFPTRIAANFYYKVYQPNYPHKNFRSKKKAEAWLKTFL